MKLLGWMHRKFKQNSSEPLKDFPVGQPSLDDFHYFPKTSYCNKSLSKGRRSDFHLLQSFANVGAARVEEEDLEEESSDTRAELFHGFLAIGTLGSDPSTPTFSISMDTIAEKETEVTENELKLINDELEKVLGAESKDDDCNLSSGRNSHVSTGRSSHCSSIITLSGKPIESAESNRNDTITCPLQEYLFGSAYEMSETPVSKKEHRTSLGELFQKTKLAEENSGAKRDRAEKRAEKVADRSAVNLMKKMLKKKIPHAYSSRFTGGNAADSTSAERKIQKILQMFHRKIHPEHCTTEEKKDKATNVNETKSNVSCKGAATNKGGCLVTAGEDIIIYPKRSFTKGSIRGFKNLQPNTPQFTITTGGGSNDNRECWIKSDADYLVLEL